MQQKTRPALPAERELPGDGDPGNARDVRPQDLAAPRDDRRGLASDGVNCDLGDSEARELRLEGLPMIRPLSVVLVSSLLSAAPMPASALDQNSTASSLGPDSLSKLNTSAISQPQAPLSAPCLPTDGHFATDGTQSWEPTCFGTWSSAFQDIRVFATRGTARDSQGKPAGSNFAQSLIQVKADGAQAREVNGAYINVDAVGGAVSQRELDSTNTTGQLISARQRPGPNGEKPPSLWGHNVDVHIAPGSGNVLTFGVEYDINNFNKDCGQIGSCLSTAIFLNGINGSPNTAWIFSGTGNTRDYRGTVSVAGGIITRLSGDEFVPQVTILKINGAEYRAGYKSANKMVADVAIPNFASVEWSSKNAAVHDGILFNGTENVSDNDFHAATTARTAFRAGGRHHVGLDTTGDNLTYAVLAKPGQKVCFNGYDACLFFKDGVLKFTNGGVEKAVSLQ